VDGVLKRCDPFCVGVGDSDIEFVLDDYDHFYRIKAIVLHILKETRIAVDTVGRDARMLDDNRP
jgi:hypothetical protein